MKKAKISSLCEINQKAYSSKMNWDHFNYLDTGSLTENNIEGFQAFNSFHDLPSRARRLVKNHSILFSTVRPNQNHYGIIELEELPENLLVSTGFAVLDVYPEYDPYYVYYALTNKRNVLRLQSIAEQSVTSYPSITPDDIGDIEILIPETIEEQKHHVSLLMNIDKKIKTNKAIISKLLSILSDSFDRWFFEFEFPNKQGEPYKQNKGSMVFNEKIKREIPFDWEVVNIKKLCDLIWGQCPDGENILDLADDDPDAMFYCSGAGDMRNGLVVDCQAKTNDSRREAKEKDILMSVAGSIGALCICDRKISLGRAAVAFRCFNIKNLAFCYSIIKKYIERIQSISSGSIQKVINDGHIDDINFAYNESVVDQFSFANNFLEKAMRLTIENRELEKLKDDILPLIMNGQIAIKE